MRPCDAILLRQHPARATLQAQGNATTFQISMRAATSAVDDFEILSLRTFSFAWPGILAVRTKLSEVSTCRRSGCWCSSLPLMRRSGTREHLTAGQAVLQEPFRPRVDSSCLHIYSLHSSVANLKRAISRLQITDNCIATCE